VNTLLQTIADGDPLSGEPIAVQTERALDNLAAVLEAAGTDLGNVLKTTVYLADVGDGAVARHRSFTHSPSA